MKTFSILVTFLFFFSNSNFSQSIKDIDRSYHINQDGFSHRFTVLTGNPRFFHPRNSKTYYWYKSQKVIMTQGGNSGMLLDGNYESSFKNKQLAEKGQFKKGLKKGIWKKWSNNGVLIAQEKWKRGRRRGKQLYFNETGQVIKRLCIRFRKTQTEVTDSIIVISRKKETIYVIDSLNNTIEVQRRREEVLHGKQEIISGEVIQTKKYKKGKLISPKEPEKKESPKGFLNLKDKSSKKKTE